MPEERPKIRELDESEALAGSCEFVDFDADETRRCRDDGDTYRIRGVAVTLCEPHLERVLIDEGLVPESRARSNGRAA